MHACNKGTLKCALQSTGGMRGGKRGPGGQSPSTSAQITHSYYDAFEQKYCLGVSERLRMHHKSQKFPAPDLWGAVCVKITDPLRWHQDHQGPVLASQYAPSDFFVVVVASYPSKSSYIAIQVQFAG